MQRIIKKSEFEQLIFDIHQNNVNYHTREIYMHSTHAGSIPVEEPGVEYSMATSFVKNLHLLDNKDQNSNILVHMHIIGGNWTDGMAVFNAVQFSKSPVVMISYAQASSMSGVILQSADKRVLMPDCEFMLHYGSVNVDGHSLAVSSQVEMNNKCNNRMLQLFSERAITSDYFKERKFSIRKVMNFFDKKLKEKSDWYLTSEEAVYYGLADCVLGDKGFETIEKIRRISKKFKGFSPAYKFVGI